MNARQRLAKSAFADSKTGVGRFRPSVARGFNLRAVRRFIERITAVRSALPENTLPVLFGYNVHPSARQETEKADLLVAAYER